MERKEEIVDPANLLRADGYQNVGFGGVLRALCLYAGFLVTREMNNPKKREAVINRAIELFGTIV